MIEVSEITATSAPGRWAALLFITQFVLIWTTFFILSNAIGWPASLDDPAVIALPRMVAQHGAVMVGYSSYLIAALLLVPAVAALNARLGLGSASGGLTIGLAAISAVAKAIGISRWLFAVPVLATDYLAPGADRATIATLFDMINAYAGGIGEIVGVGLVSGVLTMLIGVLVARSGGRGAVLVGGYAVIAGALLLFNIPAGFGVEMGAMLTISNIAWQFALLAVGIWSMLAPPQLKSDISS